MVIHLEEEKEFDSLVSEGVVLVDFYADWCGPCRMIAPVLEEVSGERTDIKVVKIDVDTFGNLAKRFSVFSIPTLKLFKDGKAVGTKVGYVAKVPLLKFVDETS